MMVRTIQHPGVEIQESEIGSYRSTVVMNNAYIMGFTDRGPIYDYSWITTAKEFTKIYGEPQTEAEKYMFTAVQSVLQNGGTPIVARMPYDNKQCKAYKAMKIKWSDMTPDNPDDLATPLVDLNKVAANIKHDKSFADIITVDSITKDGEKVDKEWLDNLTISQLAMQLNPFEIGNPDAGASAVLYSDFIPGVKINGVSPSSLQIGQEAVSGFIADLNVTQIDVTKRYYKYDSNNNQYDTGDISESALSMLYIKDDAEFYKITKNYARIDYLNDQAEPMTVFIDFANMAKTGDKYGSAPIYNANSVPGKVVNELPDDLSAQFEANPGVKNDYTLTGALGTLKSTTPLSGQGWNMSVTTSDENGKEMIVGFYAVDPVQSKFAVKPSVSYDGAVYDVFASGAYMEGITPYVDGIDLSAVYGAPLGATSGVTVNGSYKSHTTISGEVFVYGLYPLYQDTMNGLNAADGQKLSVSSIGSNRKLVAFVNDATQHAVISGKIAGSELSSYSAVLPNLDPDAEYPVISRLFNSNWSSSDDDNAKLDPSDAHGYRLKNWSGLLKDTIIGGNVRIDDYMADVKYKANFANMPARDVTEEYLASVESLIDLWTIYNNPYFMDLNKKTYSQLEAKLLTTPEMGFKYGLYLDSEDCEISNDQYDDLVTVNKFSDVDRTISKYGQDIDDANFIIVDKQKTVAQGVGGNIGYFTVIIDPFDALKVQRLLVEPKGVASYSRTVSAAGHATVTRKFSHKEEERGRLNYWAYESADAWNKIYEDLMDSMDCLQRVRNADGIYIGEPKTEDGGKPNILDSWSIPLTGGFYDDSISKILMKKFPGIAIASLGAEDLTDDGEIPSIIDHNYATHVTVAVCKTAIDQSNGKIVVNLVETFFGSLFNEKNLQNGRSLFIGDIINANSDFIEFYRNDWVYTGQGDYDPPEYRRTAVNQVYIRDSDELRNAALLRGIDYDDYVQPGMSAADRAQGEADYYRDLEKFYIHAVDKKEVCIYNLHWEANLTSFSKKESQKIIANTSNLYSTADGTTINVAKNFLVDMDRCIKFIKNIDDIPLHFICDAGLTTIAQFCDNVTWNPSKRVKTSNGTYEAIGGWVTQPFDPDNDPDGEDRYITGYEDVATWRKVAEKLIEIAGEIRKDCFAIIDAPRQLTLDGAAPKIRRSKFTNNFDKTIGRCMRYISGINSSYAAGYYNWLRTTDQYSGKSIWIPPTSKIIGNYCYLNINNLPWLAPAGLTYGLINGCHAISHNPDYQEEDQIYMKSWNYIKQYPFDGLVVEGQRTLLGKESVFERVNVRLLFLDLERFAYNVSRTFKYQVNNAYTREQFVQTLKPKFEDYTLRGGIYEYLIKVDAENNTPETIDNNELRGDIFIKPARLIEFVLLNFVGTSTGTNFTELQLG